MATRDEALAKVKKLSSVLEKRRRDIEDRLDAYRGRQPLRFASPEFSTYFEERFEGFVDNWCAPVIQAPAERMNVQGIRLDRGDSETANPEARRADRDLARVWRVNNAERGSSEGFVVMMAAARTLALVWGNPADESTPRVTWEHPANAIVGYGPDTGERVAGLKLWSSEGQDFATLYLPEEVWKFQRRSVNAGVTDAGLIVPTGSLLGSWEPRQPPGDDVWPLPNPMGVVPLVELRNQSLLDDDPISDIDGVRAMQDAVNLIWAYLLNALDYASLPQRAVTGAEIPQVPILDDQGQVVGKRPLDINTLAMDRVLWIPDSGARISEWKVATLDGYATAIEKAVEHIAGQTRTPPHYLIGKVSNLSAEAMTAAETGLVAKSTERVTYATPGIREVFRLICLAQGDDAKAEACASGHVLWKDIQYRSLAQRVDALAKLKTTGFPFEWIAEQYGLEPGEVARVMQMRRDEAELDPIGTLSRLAGQGNADPGAGPPAQE